MDKDNKRQKRVPPRVQEIADKYGITIAIAGTLRHASDRRLRMMANGGLFGGRELITEAESVAAVKRIGAYHGMRNKSDEDYGYRNDQ